MTRTRGRVLLAVGLVYASLTAQRLTLWQAGEAALWADATQASQAPRPWVNLGNAYRDDGDTVRADLAYQTAARLADARRSHAEWMIGGALAEANRGLLYWQTGPRRDDARQHGWLGARWPFLIDGSDRRRDEGRHLIARAHDRWPESAEIAALARTVRPE